MGVSVSTILSQPPQSKISSRMKFLLLLAALVSVGSGWQLRQAEEEEHDPKEMFANMDVDGSNTISAHEMEEFFADHMPEHAKGVHMMIAAFDDNGDGKINMEEAMHMAKAKGEDGEHKGQVHVQEHCR